MKNSLKNIKNSSLKLVAIYFLITKTAFAANPLLFVNELYGDVFAIGKQGMWKIKKGEYLDDFVEVVTELNAQVELNDFDNHRYYLPGQSHVKFLNKIVELKRGYVWVKSFNEDEYFSVHTANSITSFKQGEGIVSFDNVNGRSQVFVSHGELRFSNLVNDVGINLSSGQFSFIDKDYESGVPRPGTQIGPGSYQEIVKLFSKIRPMKFRDKNTAPNTTMMPVKRSVASIPQAEFRNDSLVEMNSKGPGKITFLGSRKKAPQKNKIKIHQLLQEDKKIVQRIRSQRLNRMYGKKSGVKITIIGDRGHSKMKVPAKKMRSKNQDDIIAKLKSAESTTKTNRAPASSNTTNDQHESEFNKSLNKEYMRQLRHPPEVKKLINELESFKQDYKTDY